MTATAFEAFVDELKNIDLAVVREQALLRVEEIHGTLGGRDLQLVRDSVDEAMANIVGALRLAVHVHLDG